MKKNLLLFLSIVMLMFSCSVEKQSADYVASTSWVASIAELAGVDGVISIAPVNLSHPPEYEITPDDIKTVSNAKLFMQAGYENMMKTISNASGVNSDIIIKIKTTNTLENLKDMVKLISEKAGTESEAEKRYAELEKIIMDARKRIAESENRNIEVYANENQAEFAKDIGLNVVSTFGPGQLSSEQIGEVAEKRYKIIIDNYHNPVASPINQVSPDSMILVFRNFPDHIGDNALIEVIKENLDKLWSTGLFK